MHYYVLSCIIACMILSGKIFANSANPPHLLRKASDFDNIKEPEFVKRESNARLREEDPNEIIEEKMSKIKRDLGQVGHVFVNNYFRDNSDSKGDSQRDVFKEIQTEDLGTTIKQSIPYFQKENENLIQGNQYTGKATESVTFQKRTADADKDLKMHFYKHSPHKNKHKMKDGTKPVTLNLYPENMFNSLPKSFDYIAIVGDDDKLVAVPAVKMNFVTAKVQRSSHFEPFFSTRFKRQNSISILPEHAIMDIPVLFLNTMSEFEAKKHKRSSHLDELENKYLREADLLIQSVNASLQMMGLNNSMKPIYGGFLISPKNKHDSVFTVSSESDEDKPLTISFALDNTFMEWDFTTQKEDEMSVETEAFKSQTEPIESGSSEESKLAKSHVTIESYKFISNLPKRQSLDGGLTNSKSLSKNFVMPEDRIFDLVKVADNLRKSDSNLKCLTGNENDCYVLAQKQNETTTEKLADTTTSCSSEVFPSSPTYQKPLENEISSSTLEPIKLVNNSLSLESLNNFTSTKNNFEKYLSSATKTSVVSSSFNSTQQQGNFINETNIYEDDSDVDNVLDLLANMSTPLANNGLNTTSTTPFHISISVPSILTIPSQSSSNSTPKIAAVKYESTTISVPESSTSQVPKKQKKSLLDKLHNLQKDLKLVFEVQNILNGAKKESTKNKRSKREAINQTGSHLRLKRRCKNCRPHRNMAVPATADNKVKQIEALGKILEWKNYLENQHTERDRRFSLKKKKKDKKRRKKKKKKKDKKKKKKGFWKRIFGDALTENEAFLGQHIQNQF